MKYTLQIKTAKFSGDWYDYVQGDNLKRLQVMTDILKGNANVEAIRIIEVKIIESHSRKTTNYTLAG